MEIRYKYPKRNKWGVPQLMYIYDIVLVKSEDRKQTTYRDSLQS